MDVQIQLRLIVHDKQPTRGRRAIDSEHHSMEGVGISPRQSLVEPTVAAIITIRNALLERGDIDYLARVAPLLRGHGNIVPIGDQGRVPQPLTIERCAGQVAPTRLRTAAPEANVVTAVAAAVAMARPARVGRARAAGRFESTLEPADAGRPSVNIAGAVTGRIRISSHRRWCG